MRERKKTAVQGTLEMTWLAWKFNSKQLLSKTLNSRINIIETRAVLNIFKIDGQDEGVFLRNFQFRSTLYRNLILGRMLSKLAMQGGTLGYKTMF